MDKYTPMTSSEAKYRWEDDFNDCVIGWANRDSHNTKQSVRPPQNILAVGDSWNKEFFGTDKVRMDASVATSPLVVLTLEPMIAPAIPHEVGGSINWDEVVPTELWGNLHRDLNYINRVESLSFEAPDLQAVTFMIAGGIMAPLAQLFKALDYLQVTKNINNTAIENRELLNALGFPNGLGDTPSDREKYLYGPSIDGLIRYINTEIIAKLNQYYWCYDFVPMMWRWPALLSRTWKEDNDEQQYTTLYTFKLGHYLMPGYTPLSTKDKNANAKAKRKFDRYKNTVQTLVSDGVLDSEFLETINTTDSQLKGVPTSPTGLPGTYKLTQLPPAAAPSLWSLAKLIAASLDIVINDEDFRNITTTMQTIMEKKGDNAKLSNGVTLSKLEFEYYPYFGRPIDIIYQPAMLVAIHNATLCPLVLSDVVEVADPSQPDVPNKLVQTVRMDTGDAQKNATIAVMRCDQPYDVPEQWSEDNWGMQLTASQWKIMSYPEQPADEYFLSPKILGFDVLTKAEIFHPWSTNETPSPAYIRNTKLTISGALWLTPDPGVSVSYTEYKKIAYITQCGWFPLTPMVYSTDQVAPFTYNILGYPTDIAHISFINFRALQSLKEQFVRNGLGYPLQLPCEEGKFDGLQESGESVGNQRPAQDASSDSSGGSGSPSSKPRRPKPEETK